MNGNSAPLRLATAMLAASFVTCTTALLPCAATGQTRPAPQRILSHAATQDARSKSLRPLAGGPPMQRRWVGTIEQLGPAGFTLLRRNGKLQTVDDSVALQNGTYSAPLFVGKIVVVIGTFDAKAGVLHAATITRMTYFDPGTPPEI